MKSSQPSDGGVAGGRAWNGRRWYASIGLALAVELVLVFALSEPPGPGREHRRAPSQFQLLSAATGLPRWREAPWLGDAAQFALVSPQGFSGPVWQQLPRFSAQAMEWSEPPRWLTQDASTLGRSFVPGLERDGRPERVVAERPVAVARGLPVFGAMVRSNSTLQVEGELAKRRMLTKMELGVWPHQDVLLPSTVQVMVNDQGVVMSATLLGGSGLAAADQKALELARAARFEPVGSAAEGLGLCWGRLVFEWQAVEPARTNPPPARASP